MSQGKGRYIGTAQEVLAKLHEDGHPTQWYRGAATDEPLVDSMCGPFTMYLLEDGMAYTTLRDGQAYKEYRHVKQEPRCWYCSGCKKRFGDWPSAGAHRDAKLDRNKVKQESE